MGVRQMRNMLAVLLVAMGAFSTPGQGATVAIKASVVKTMVADQDRFGGCMARLDRNLADYGLNCSGKWVTFSCSGVYASRDTAYRMFDSAQMAFALGRKVSVQVDDTRKHDGHCYAARIDVLQ